MTLNIIDLIVTLVLLSVACLIVMLNVIMLSFTSHFLIVKLSVAFSYSYAECHYAECRYAECRGALGVAFTTLNDLS
jgi:hypothetical protein